MQTRVNSNGKLTGVERRASNFTSNMTILLLQQWYGTYHLHSKGTTLDVYSASISQRWGRGVEGCEMGACLKMKSSPR